MEPLEILLVLGLVYVLYKGGTLASIGIAPPPPPGVAIAAAAPTYLTPPPSFGTGMPVVPAQEVPSNVASTAVGVGSAIAAAPKVLGAIGVAANAVPIVGQVVSAVASIAQALLGAHNARIKQARDENSAMNLGVQGVDKEMAVINNAYNAGQISAQDAINLLSQTMPHYWELVAPHIQPGRNGCNATQGGAAACPPWPASGNGCSGSIGAACCVGCYDLEGGPSTAVLSAFDGGDGRTPFYFGVQGAIVVLMHGGHMQTCMQGVVASKYGGANRNGYRLNWQQVGS